MKEFKWTKFYMELADELLPYKNDRASLIEIIKSIYQRVNVKLPTLDKGNNIVDVDPFTFFALFNKNINDDTRILLLTAIKDIFRISAAVPDQFDGIPLVNPMKATFYHFSGNRKETDIDHLWNLFEAALSYADHPAEHKEELIYWFDTVSQQAGIKWNLTMGLYWFRPYTYLSLEAKNRQLLANNQARFSPRWDVNSFLNNLPGGEDYLEFIADVSKTLTEYESFPELSCDAWKQVKEDKDKFYGEKKLEYWPDPSEYNPGISKVAWKKYLLEVEKPHHPRPMQMLKAMLDIGGEATCKKLAEVYGGTANGYVGCCVALGRRAKEYFRLPACMDNGEERFFPVAFLGRQVAKEKNEGTYSYRLRNELAEALKEIDLSDVSTYYEDRNETMKQTAFDKNIILCGPPGTGKTYYTAIYAVAIIEGKSLEQVAAEAYPEIQRRYHAYRTEGKIAFTTFHQSYGYEEFIEGIKPVIHEEDAETKDVSYEVVPGVFKKFCDKITLQKIAHGGSDYAINESPNVWKVSLEGTGENETRTECLENGHIRIGWDAYGENITEETDYSSEGGKKPLNAFINRMKIGDLVLSCYTATTIDAVGVVTGEYEWHPEYPRHRRLRKVTWLVKNIRENIMNLTQGTTMTLSAVYQFPTITAGDVLRLIEKHNKSENPGNYVFIIDEINRGNISKILGELITLIEPKKRQGQSEEMQAVLPYSQKEFSVPDNVYIIGTMNTADRSIAAIDTALRRRFSFCEMQPKPQLFEGLQVAGISVSKMLETMNRRIEVLYDREHTIGHAYLIPLATNSSIEVLAEIFRNKIIPLLQEYFYEDYEKIRLVLGDNQKTTEPQFIVKESIDEIKLFGEDTDIVEDACRYTVNPAAFTQIEAYKKMTD